ncbi:MAG: ATP phosphoribosyltransferase regulatory subunit [Gammaproteobacteria bacterium]|nr:ATP phosphoribosyltransferase regulatory subunit [Gammaproteobacteria bacterium]
MSKHAWRLPDGMDEVLPPDAWALEALRRRVLDLFHAWGYEYVMPALVEYLDSLLVGSGNDLELQTFRMVDQRSGRMLGVRADMTSQAARIDAASFGAAGTRRLCYAGTVVHANPAGVLESRLPLLAGAELFGVADVEADAEVIALMVAALACAGVANPVIELGHVGFFRALAASGKLGEEERALFEALQNKSEPDIDALTRRSGIKGAVRRFLCALPNLMGGDEVLGNARELCAGLPAATLHALDELAQLAAAVRRRCPDVSLRFDLGELTGYGYHTGPVFTAFSPAFGRPVARGGRYDAVGRVFGGARPATGFDVNLKRLPRPAVSLRAPSGLRWVC